MLIEPVFLSTPPGAGGRNMWKGKFELISDGWLMVIKVMAIQQSNPTFWEGGNMATKAMMNLIQWKCWCSHMKIPEPMMDPTMIVHPWTSPRVFFNPPDSSSISSIWYWYLSWSYCVCVCTGCFFNWFRPKSSKCWSWQNPYQKSESLS